MTLRCGVFRARTLRLLTDIPVRDAKSALRSRLFPFRRCNQRAVWVRWPCLGLSPALAMSALNRPSQARKTTVEATDPGPTVSALRAPGHFCPYRAAPDAVNLTLQAVDKRARPHTIANLTCQTPSETAHAGNFPRRGTTEVLPGTKDYILGRPGAARPAISRVVPGTRDELNFLVEASHLSR